MMLYPSVDALMEKINSKYTLVTISAKRARELSTGAKSMLDEEPSQKFVGMALREIMQDKLTYTLPNEEDSRD
jgi:DNA-directed RNA polymerase subunit omega